MYALLMALEASANFSRRTTSKKLARFWMHHWVNSVVRMATE